MEKSISTNPKTNIIIFWDNSEKFITTDENQQIEVLMSQGLSGFELNNSKFKFNDIKKYLTIKEYYNLYPHRQITSYKNYSGLTDVVNSFSEQRKKKALQSIVKGFEKYFTNRAMPVKSQAMLNKMKTRLI